MIEFKDLPDTSTPINAQNLNNNFNKLKPYVLYSNDTGATGSITLNDSANNYNYLMVCWKSTYNGSRKGVALAPTNNYWTLFSKDIDINNYASIYECEALYYINDTSFNLVSSNDYNGDNNNLFYITKVVGYK